jgi:hypothetical protein
MKVREHRVILNGAAVLANVKFNCVPLALGWFLVNVASATVTFDMA